MELAAMELCLGRLALHAPGEGVSVDMLEIVGD